MSGGTVEMRAGLPHGGVRGGAGNMITTGTVMHGKDFKPMVLKNKKGRGSRHVILTAAMRKSPAGDSYRLVMIPYSSAEKAASSRNRHGRFRPLWGEYLWEDRSKLRPENPSHNRLDFVMPKNPQFHTQWVRADRLAEVE